MSQVPNPQSGDDTIEIREVWNSNLEEEMDLILHAIEEFCYVAMDTEYPGTVYKAENPTQNPKHYVFNYETIKSNVNMLKLIQLGLTLSDERGNLPTCGTNKQCVWQFNFREFNVNFDKQNKGSIKLLSESGIDFKKNYEYGVDSTQFAVLLIGSGVVLNDNTQLVTYHGGYDIGYLLKLLSGKNLPEEKWNFFNLVSKFFPVMYDVKYMVEFCCGPLHGGLKKLADTLGVQRVGVSHQAGSDSLLTSRVFFKMRQTILTGSLDRFSGVLHGLDNPLLLPGTKQ